MDNTVLWCLLDYAGKHGRTHHIIKQIMQEASIRISTGSIIWITCGERTDNLCMETALIILKYR